MTIDEAIDIFKCIAYHNVRPNEEDIEQAIEALKERMSNSEKPNKWIPLTKRPMTEKEREECKEWSGITERMILDCPLPKDGEEVLVCYGSYVFMDIFHNDDNCYFEEVNINEAEAWMPLPLPYRAESEEV